MARRASPPRAAARLGLAALVGLCCVTGVIVVAIAQGASSAPEYLPDLRQRVPAKVSVQVRQRGGRTLFKLGFRSVVENVGAGPLVVRGQRVARRRGMVADQVIARGDGSTTMNSGVGTLRYTRLRDHAHWHFLRFDRYTLRSASTGRLVRRDRKTGFCLTDGERVRGFSRRVPEAVGGVGFDDNHCARRRPLARRLTEGISVGWFDDYNPYLEGQDIDITGLRSGRYELAHHVNSNRRLRELRYDNNGASVLLRVSYRGSAIPRITVLRRCAGRLRCP